MLKPTLLQAERHTGAVSVRMNFLLTYDLEI